MTRHNLGQEADLARAGIAPHAWIINQSLAASGTQNPLLRLRGEYERPFIRRVAADLSPRAALIPWLAEAPVGSAGLARIVA
jgi:arsenite-transporting ATPase